MTATASQWRRRSAGSSAAAAATAVVATSSLAVVDKLAKGRGGSPGARHPSVAGGGLLAVAGGSAACPAERRRLRHRGEVSSLPAPPPPPRLRREGSTCGRVAIDAQPTALPRSWPDGRRIRRRQRCSAGNSAAAYPTAVVGTSSPIAVDADIAGERGRPSRARRPSVAGSGLLAVAGGGAACPAERRRLRHRDEMRLLPAPPPPLWSRREGSTGGRVVTDAQPVALPRGWPDGRRIRRWRCCSAGNSAAAYPTAVVGACSPVAVDADITRGRGLGRLSGARRPSVAGGGLLTACWRQCRKSCRAQAAPPPATEMRGCRGCAARLHAPRRCKRVVDVAAAPKAAAAGRRLA